MPQVIGFAGYKGSGKSTIALEISKICSEDGKTCCIMSLADPIREMCRIFLQDLGFGFQEATILLAAPKLKEEPLPGHPDITPRKLMQTLGTEWGRDCIRSTIWIDINETKIARSNYDMILIDDVRFDNEASMISRQGWVVEIQRDSVVPDLTHSSENIPSPISMVLENNGEPSDTARKIYEALIA